MPLTRTATTTQYNDEDLLQSSDDDSDIEEMLNEPPTFSQTSYSASQQEETEQQSTPSITKEESVEEKGKKWTCMCYSITRKAIVKTFSHVRLAAPLFAVLAQLKAKHLELDIADNIKSPSDLFWHRQSKKKEPFPCRICHESELVLAPYLETKKWDKEKQELVQYLGEYQGVNQRAIVLKTQLTPFHNSEGEIWCPSIVKEYIRALEKRKGKNKFTSVKLRVEELYLEQVLNKARENQAAAIQTAQEEANARTLELESDVEDSNAAPVKSPPTKRPAIKSFDGEHDSIKHKLRAGDVIEYTNPMFVQGHQEGYRCTKILSIQKNQPYPLVLENAEFLPRGHLIRRVQRLVRNKLVEYNGNVRAISDFRMEYDFRDITAATSLKEQAKEVGRIVDKHVAKYKPKLEAVGLPMNLLNNMDGRKRARRGKENETDIVVNEKEEGDSKMAAIGTTEGCYVANEPPNKKRRGQSPFKDDFSRRVKSNTNDSSESVKHTEHDE
jgi:hypothetical protein